MSRPDDPTRAQGPYRRKISRSRRKVILERHGNKCYICEAADVPLQLDHQVPLFLGGKDEDFNLRPLCEPCHKRKTIGENKIRGKINRLSGKTKKRTARMKSKQVLQSNKTWPKGPSRWPKGRKIQSRGFEKRKQL